MWRRLLSVLVLLTAAVSSTVLSGQEKLKDPLLDKAAALRNHLEKKGFQVLGDVDYSRYVKLDFPTLYCQGLIDSCNGNNFGAPYLAGAVPPAPNQEPTVFPLVFRLRKSEAVVLVGTTPPPCDYYSYVCFLFRRYGEDWGPNDSRKIFSSLGDPLNRFVIKTGGGEFNKNIILIYTPDESTDKAVRAAAKAAGFPQDVINTYVVPSSLVQTNDNLDVTTDQLVVAQRTALWRDGTDDGGGYLDNPRTVVFRVTPVRATSEQSPGPNLFPTPKQRVRGTGRTETDYKALVDTLREAILARYPGSQHQELTTIQWLPQSPIALQSNYNTLGDSSDSAYLGTKEFFKLSEDPNDFLIAFGVNHEKSGKATYHNLNIYQASKYCGVASAFSHCYGTPRPTCFPFQGTASDYLTDLPPADVEKLYALKIARNCNGDPHCLTVPVGSCGQGTSLDDELFAFFRIYVEPETKAGPAYTELLFDRVIHFTPAAPSLAIDVNPVTCTFPAPANVTFTVTTTTPGDVTWTAQAEYLDDVASGSIQPDEGVIPGGSGNASFTFTENRAGTFFLTINVKDSESRFACNEVKVVASKP